ncbi:LolA family protein [Amycolatopsis panacis]|uniref:Outer membrane lipoprotein carrier protein LolA n=1 Tax=Amycolatopsis panacis TaxID=2340917 RepID=A0A419I1S2_9PSEU|nr:outer membrane lipoprotein carrier protein LolA [Amycolatopsis panacis]RJQ83656.1 outer membrane lipoprotein carrier protein LolA [Amycolatopsis panacis]
MDPKKKAITAAVVGTALGVGGLVVVAMPASAGAAPQLPQVSAEDLVQSVMTAKPGPFDGTVQVSNDLGLPQVGNAIPGAAMLNVDSAHVFSDGAGKAKVSLARGTSQETFIHNGNTIWDYKSQDNTATKTTIPAGVATGQHGMGEDKAADPATAAKDLLAKVKETSTVAVDGTANVANRPAYELVLTPKPSERTLLREIRVAVDSQTRMPLRVSVMGNGTTSPVLQLAFDQIEFAPQSADLFTFTPPKGAKVTEKTPKADDKAKSTADQAKQDTKVVGNGWDTVVVGKLPAEALQQKQGQNGEKGNVDPQKLLDRFTKPVSGTWGSGHLLTTKVGTAVLTDDGRFAAGAVPEQVLFEALGSK